MVSQLNSNQMITPGENLIQTGRLSSQGLKMNLNGMGFSPTAKMTLFPNPLFRKQILQWIAGETIGEKKVYLLGPGKKDDLQKE